MKVIQTKLVNHILPKGYVAITLWPFVLVRTDVTITDRLLNHESIHGEQQLEMMLIGFYLWYVVEWLVRLCIDSKTAYRNISFEREARAHETCPNERQLFGWFKYLQRNILTN